MRDRDWKKAEDLFHLLLQKEAGERQVALDQLRRDRPDLHQRVGALLTSFDKAGNFLEEPAFEIRKGIAGKNTRIENCAEEFPPADQVIGHYRVIKKLGEGGMGKVFLAEDTELERKVALKFLPEALQEDVSAHKRFLREAKSAAALDHPFICNVHEVCHTSVDKDFIVMEFVEGSTLKELLGEGPLPIVETLRIGTEVAEALEAAHKAGIIHRDLKPANIMLTVGGHAKVMDFGLAKRLVSEEEDVDISSALTEKGTTLGTLAYMSPEQLGGEKVEQRSDIFSLGIILYEMLTGTHPFRRARQVDTFNAILSSRPPPLTEHRAQIPERLEGTIQKMLGKAPEERHQNAGEVRSILFELSRHLDQGHEPRKTQFHRWLPIPLGLVATAVLVWLFLGFASREDPTRDLNPIPLTSYVGQEREPSLSPDGSQVAFSWDGQKQDNFDIYVKRIGPGEPLRLTDHPARDYSPVWSPDDRFIAFLRAREDGMASLLLIPPLGGLEQEKAQIHAPYLPADWDYGHFLAWSPDAKWLAVCDKDSEMEPWKIFLLSVESGVKREVTNPPEDYHGDKGPIISPDGQNLVFSRLSEVIGSGDLFRIDLSASGKGPIKPERLTSLNRPIDSLAWVPNTGDVVFFTQGAPSTWRVNVAALKSQPRPIPEIDGSQVTTALESNRLVFSESSKETNIWCLHLAGELIRQERIIASTKSDMSPDYSKPEGKRIAFVSTRNGTSEIWICNSDGSSALQLTDFGGPWVGGPRWSPDGRLITFDSRKTGNSDIYLVSSGGGKPIRITDHPGQDGEPTWSKNGREIYFNSDRSGVNQVWRIPATGGKAIQITSNGGSNAQEAFDERVLYFKKADLLWRMPVEGGDEKQLLEERLRSGPSFAVVENGIYFVPRSSDGEESIKFYNFASESTSTIMVIEKELNWGLSVSPDCKRILFPQVDYIHSDLRLVEQFR